jgi:hypothetical protein
MKWIFSDQDQYFKDQYQESWFSEETGWWTEKGEIYIWTPGQERLKQIGVAVHESFEWFVICRLIRGLRKHWVLFAFLANTAHFVSNILEFIVSSGRADQYWGKQNWYGGKDQGFASKKENRYLPGGDDFRLLARAVREIGDQHDDQRNIKSERKTN